MHIIHVHEYSHDVIYGDIQSKQFSLFTYKIKLKDMKLKFNKKILIHTKLGLSINMNQESVNLYKQERYICSSLMWGFFFDLTRSKCMALVLERKTKKKKRPRRNGKLKKI